MPDHLKNSRNINLAYVTADKKAEDQSIFSGGILSFGEYYSPEERDKCIVYVDENRHVRYKNSDKRIQPGSHMYVVLPSGELCIDDPLTHSQLNAGEPVQSGGHLVIEKEGTISQIDNFSGHYLPTLSQFLSTIVGLHRVGILNEQILIKLHSQTKLDYKFSIDYFGQLIANQHAKINFKPSGNIIIIINDADALRTNEKELCPSPKTPSRYSFLCTIGEKEPFTITGIYPPSVGLTI